MNLGRYVKMLAACLALTTFVGIAIAQRATDYNQRSRSLHT